MSLSWVQLVCKLHLTLCDCFHDSASEVQPSSVLRIQTITHVFHANLLQLTARAVSHYDSAVTAE